MINLQELLLSGNLLSGTIPAELYDAKRLEVRGNPGRDVTNR
jgi:hypothetical protein